MTPDGIKMVTISDDRWSKNHYVHGGVESIKKSSIGFNLFIQTTNFSSPVDTWVYKNIYILKITEIPLKFFQLNSFFVIKPMSF